MDNRLTRLTPGMAIPYGGDRVALVSEELAAAFCPGDRLVVVQSTGDLLRISGTDWDIAARAVERAHQAFSAMGAVTDRQISDFYESFARRLADDTAFAPIAEANRADVKRAQARGQTSHPPGALQEDAFRTCWPVFAPGGTPRPVGERS